MLSKISKTIPRLALTRPLSNRHPSINIQQSSILSTEQKSKITTHKKYLSTSILKCQSEQSKPSEDQDSTDIGGLHEVSKEVLARMGIDQLFEVQAVTFKKTKQGNDLIVQAPTGSGLGWQGITSSELVHLNLKYFGLQLTLMLFHYFHLN